MEEQNNPESYYIVYRWMRRELELNGAELDAYAVIYSYSRDGVGAFFGSLAYLGEMIGASSRTTVIKALANLQKKGLITKTPVTRNGTLMHIYRAVQLRKEGVQKMNTPRSENEYPPVQKMNTPCSKNEHNNKPINNINNIDISTPENKPEITDNPEPFMLHQDAAREPEPADRVPYSEIQDLYNKICGGRLTKCVRMTDKRKKAIAARWKEEGRNIDFFRKLFEAAAKSEFLSGGGDRGFVADFDFILKPEKVTKILEGAYDNRANNIKRSVKKNGTTDNTDKARADAERIARENEQSRIWLEKRNERIRQIKAERERLAAAGGVHGNN